MRSCSTMFYVISRIPIINVRILTMHIFKVIQRVYKRILLTQIRNSVPYERMTL